MKYQIRFAAVGGQGIITAGALLTHVAVEKELKHAAESPTYTSAVRGEPTKVDVVISDSPILFPIATEVDFFLCTEQRSFDLYKKNLKDNAIVVIDSHLITNVGDTRDWKVYHVPLINQTKTQLGNIIYVSVVSLSITQKLTNIVQYENTIEHIKEWAPKGFLKNNLDAIELGRSMV